MLRSIDLIHTAFKEVDDLWNALVNRKNIVFYLLILENFGLSDDLYIKMNARGRLLTPFENFKAEIQDKAIKENWESSKEEKEKYLSSASISSTFAREQVKEEVLKSKIIQKFPEHKNLLFKTEDNELLRGRITFALQCAGYQTQIDEIDFEMLDKIQTVFAKYFNRELEPCSMEFDKFRRAMLTIEVSGKYQYYNYWWSYWNAASAEKRKLFPVFREIEYFIGLNDYNTYFKKLVLKLTQADYDSILSGFSKPDNMENWQYRLIKEENLLSNCSSKYIAISPDRAYCFLMRSKRPSDISGSMKIE